MVAEQLPGKGVQRRLDGGDLGEDVRAVALFFHHAPDAPDLTFDPVKALDQGIVFRRFPVLVAAALRRSSTFLMFHGSFLTFLN